MRYYAWLASWCLGPASYGQTAPLSSGKCSCRVCLLLRDLQGIVRFHATPSLSFTHQPRVWIPKGSNLTQIKPFHPQRRLCVQMVENLFVFHAKSGLWELPRHL